MKKTILLFILSVLTAFRLTCYVNKVNIDKKNGAVISYERIITEDSSDVQEINYFEKSEDLDNCIVNCGAGDNVKIELSDETASQGKYSMKIYWKIGERAEIVIISFPDRWGDYSELVFDILNPYTENIIFEIKISDRVIKTNEYAERFTLSKGKNTFSIDIKEIAKIIEINSPGKTIHVRFFSNDRMFFLDNMRLMK